MKNEIYYFTGTGNSLHISKELAKNLGDTKLLSISKLRDKEKIISEADTVGIVFPIYCWDLPSIVEEFIKKFKASNDTYVYVVCNCGASFGGALKLTEDLLNINNNELSSAFTVFMPDNSIAYATDEKLIPEFLNNMPSKVKDIADIVLERSKTDIKGKRIQSKVLGKAIELVCKNILGFDRIIVDQSSCSSCGLCEKVCPVDNIHMDKGIPNWGKQCEMCFACIHYCPKQSISYMRQKTLTNYQYTNPEVTIDEIIAR